MRHSPHLLNITYLYKDYLHYMLLYLFLKLLLSFFIPTLPLLLTESYPAGRLTKLRLELLKVQFDFVHYQLFSYRKLHLHQFSINLAFLLLHDPLYLHGVLLLPTSSSLPALVHRVVNENFREMLD